MHEIVSLSTVFCQMAIILDLATESISLKIYTVLGDCNQRLYVDLSTWMHMVWELHHNYNINSRILLVRRRVCETRCGGMAETSSINKDIWIHNMNKHLHMNDEIVCPSAY